MKYTPFDVSEPFSPLLPRDGDYSASLKMSNKQVSFWEAKALHPKVTIVADEMDAFDSSQLFEKRRGDNSYMDRLLLGSVGNPSPMGLGNSKMYNTTKKAEPKKKVYDVND